MPSTYSKAGCQDTTGATSAGPFSWIATCVKSKDGRTAWERRFGKEFHGKLIPFGSVLYRRPKHDAAKFAPRDSRTWGDRSPLAIEDEVTVEGGVLQRIPRASGIYMPKVGPPPRPPVPTGPLDDSTAITFNIENPKRPSSRAHEIYKLYKTATTIGEARRLGASTGHIKYDLSKSRAKLVGTTAVVCVGPTYALTDFGKQDPEAALAAPLLEAWCDQQSPLRR